MKLLGYGLLIVCSVAIFGALASAAEPEPKNYLLFRVNTPLQRVLIFDSDADVYVQIDVAQCLRDKKFDPARLGDEFRKDLVAFAPHGKAKPKLQLAFRYSGVWLEPKDSEAMENAVTEMGRQAGFVRFGTMMTGEGRSWREKLDRFKDVVDEPDATESPVASDVVRVYPVRTRLSRFLLGDVQDDCYISLRQAIDGRFKGFSPGTRQSLEDCLAKLPMRHKRRVIFRYSTTTPGDAIAQTYFASGMAVPSPADLFVKGLGFESAASIRSSCGVNPESLLGKPAPDFTLDALTGEKIHLREMIRGRVAIIAFWGVACGPCCKEAPYLSAIYDRYKDQGLAVIGVNAYDESPAVVGRFVRSKHLTHSIALKGGKVGAEQYTVHAYPMTYFVDHTGAIVDYHLGFDPGDEKLLSKAVESLLAERQAAIHVK
jgi:peroxiredoxin